MDALIDKIYEKEDTKENKKQDIRCNDVKKYGDVALKMANANKKGWNALMMSELLDGKFQIPEYILDALVFVADVSFLEKRNYLKILRNYGEVYADADILTLIAEKPEIELGELLKAVKNDNDGCTVIKLLHKVVER